MRRFHLWKSRQSGFETEFVRVTGIDAADKRLNQAIKRLTTKSPRYKL
jgi:hypothetical protein